MSDSCNHMDCNPLGSFLHGISQARILEWLPFLSLGNLPSPEIEPTSPALAGRSFTTEPPGKPYQICDMQTFSHSVDCLLLSGWCPLQQRNFLFWWCPVYLWASHLALLVKKPPANAGDIRNERDIRNAGLIPALGRSPGGRHGNPLQYSCLPNPMVREAWRATVHRVAQSQIRLK